MNRENGVSVFLTSHDLDDIEEICDDAIVLSNGRLFYNGTLEKLKNSYVKSKIIKIIENRKSDISKELSEAQITYKGKNKYCLQY